MPLQAEPHVPPRRGKRSPSAEPGVALLGPTRLALIVLLFADEQRSCHVRELVRLTHASSGAVQRELKRLSSAGLIRRTVRAGRVFFQADARAPLFGSLHLLVEGLASSPVRRDRGPGPEEDYVSTRARHGGHITRAQHDRHFAFISLTIDRWILRHFGRVYVAFDGDLVAAMVLGEVAHHNVSGLAARLDYDRARIRAVLAGPAALEAMLPCNAYSISEATRVPRETVRRKVEQLVARGWLLRNDKRDLFITLKGARAFAGTNLETVNDLLESVDRLRARVFGDDRPGLADSPRGR